jgi:hypothetical protein
VSLRFCTHNVQTRRLRSGIQQTERSALGGVRKTVDVQSDQCLFVVLKPRVTDSIPGRTGPECNEEGCAEQGNGGCCHIGWAYECDPFALLSKTVSAQIEHLPADSPTALIAAQLYTCKLSTTCFNSSTTLHM